MNCDDCQRRLHARLDGEAVPADDLAAHLAACPECRGLEAAARRLQAGLRLLTAPVPPAELAERLTAGVLADRRRRSRRRRLAFAGAVAAMAASLLLTLYALPDGSGSSGWLEQKYYAIKYRLFGPPTLTFSVSVATRLTDFQLAEEPAAPSLNEDVAEATSAVASLARRTADETVNNGQVLVPSLSVPMPTEELLAPPLEPPAASLREAGHGVAAGLEPVASSARRAIDLFLRDIPPVAPEAKPGL